MEKKEDDDRRAKKLPIEEGCLSKGSVIVYVWRQKDTEIVAEQLNGAGIRGGVVCYHGGMNAGDRSRAQSKVSRLFVNLPNDTTGGCIFNFAHITDLHLIITLNSFYAEKQGFALPQLHLV